MPEEAVIAQAAETYVLSSTMARRASAPSSPAMRRRGRPDRHPRGLAEGEMVMTRGTARLRDGTAVKVLNEPATAAAPARGDGT